MKRFNVYFSFLAMIVFLAISANAQSDAKETYTGTVLSYGTGVSTRAVTNNFTLIINGKTSNERAQTLLTTLQEGKQDELLDAIKNDELGRFSVGANVGVPVNVVRESTVDGKKRIFIVFQRWTQFAEVRGGYRSLDYPFGVIEMFIDETTGKGEGTYIAAAKIKMDYDEKKKEYGVEIENFGTYPARLLGVKLSGEKRKQVKVGN